MERASRNLEYLDIFQRDNLLRQGIILVVGQLEAELAALRRAPAEHLPALQDGERGARSLDYLSDDLVLELVGQRGHIEVLILTVAETAVLA